MALADVTGDGVPEVIGITMDDRVSAVDGTGTILWTSAALTLASYPQITVADLEGDGSVEIIVDKWVIAGADGASLLSLSPSSSVLYRTPVVGDLDQDGSQEILIGDKVYDASGTGLWTNSGTSYGNFAALLDADGDAGAEVFVVSGNQGYLHDSDGTELASFAIPGGYGASAPCVADFDGDGDPEVGVNNYNTLSVFETDGTLVWSVEIGRAHV